jgi:hypothetical protein
MNFFWRSQLQPQRKSLILNRLQLILRIERPSKNPSLFSLHFSGGWSVLQAPLDAKKGQAQTLGKAYEANQP